ncbi:MAG: 2-amino-4-hydroxy-6-hydroxymethyldihydropteridine diphosphokinase [Woeseiaceae bacterium]|nr:2-amino-4-hydroxy-6-hydroxymethyldihydropteridine diphosphokinase [Woeseiaceae bacterium]
MDGDSVNAFVGIGSNLAYPSRQVESAIDRLSELPGARLLARSSLYRSTPFGGVEQPDFINAAAHLKTTLSPRALLEALQGVERAHGRERDGERWGPRVIDLDLLVYGSCQISEPGLDVPHPGIAERNFVLLPLSEIAPDLDVPGLGPLSSIAINYCEPQIERIA